MREVHCVYCEGCLVKIDQEVFMEFPRAEGDGADLEPMQPGDVCCWGPEMRTPQAAYDRACGYFD